jgi:hypothetical protein
MQTEMSQVNFKQTTAFQKRLASSLNKLLRRIRRIQIGTPKQFPDGWGRAAKGRTVWRIVEEAVVQNLKKHRASLGLAVAEVAPREVDIYDVKIRFKNSTIELFLNLKTYAAGLETKKGDISKAKRIIEFFDQDVARQLFIVRLVIRFSADMCIEIKECLVVPITWLPDIDVNYHNHNLQCRQPKTLGGVTRRTNSKFVAALQHAIRIADAKRQKKANQKS